MKQFAKTASDPNYLFGLLPVWFKENDNYVPNTVPGYTAEGLLERYLEIFCLEIDSELSPYIEGIGKITDALSLDELPHDDPNIFLIPLAADLGNPPDIGTTDQYKNLLRHIREINQHKGTTEGISLFLALFGYKINDITESSITVKEYDAIPTALEYDATPTVLEYDEGFAFYSGYDLEITDLPGTGTKNPSSDWLLLLKQAIQKFISPIFAQLTNLTYI